MEIVLIISYSPFYVIVWKVKNTNKNNYDLERKKFNPNLS